MVPIKSATPYLNHSIVLGFEYRKLVSTGFVAAIPSHPLFRKVLDAYESFDINPEKSFKFLINNELWTYILKNNYMLKLNDKTQLLPTDIKVYPATYFSEMKLTDQSIFLHDHQLS
jgi:hypothetical protein